MNRFDTTMDGRELFAQLAAKVARGDLVITHFAADITMDRNLRRSFDIQGQVFTPQSASATLNMKVSAVDNSERGLPAPPAQVSIPHQVRELIFDGETEPDPIYDEDLT